MKKLIIKCVMMIAIFFGISQYFLYLTTGKSPLDGLKTSEIQLSAPDIKNITASGKQTVYKWVDANGVTQYTSEAPPEQAVTAMELDPNTNIVQGIKMPEDEEKEEKPPQAEIPQGNIYNPKSIKKLMDDANNVQKLLNDRYEQQEKGLQDM